MFQKSDDHSPPHARLLKGAAFLLTLLGGIMVVWGVDKWIRYPEARASQLGFEAPLWPAFVAFTLLGTAVAATLLWATARRVEAGENLFAKRRKRGSGEEEQSAPNQEPAPDPLHRSN